MEESWFRVKCAWPSSTSFEMTTRAESAPRAFEQATLDADYQQILAGVIILPVPCSG